MNEEEIKTTDIWDLYEHGINFMNMRKMFTDTDLNYEMTDGNQWRGAKIDGIEPAQYNFISTIVNYKSATLNQNLWKIVYSSENFDNKRFLKTADETCKLLNRKANRVWENDQMDYKVRVLTRDSCINDEGVIYVNYDEDTQSPINEIINKTDIHYGNENNSSIQEQPYILVSQRISVKEAQNIAEKNGISGELVSTIKGDNDNFKQAGNDSKIEKDPMCTLITKMWKENGEVWYSKSLKYLIIVKPKNTRLKLYPVAHFNWVDKKGDARGEGEVRYLIPNQLELNKTLARMLLSVKRNAYPTKIVNIEKIKNPNAIDSIGGTIKIRGQGVDDVNKMFGYVAPAQMSGDVAKTINDLISITRELKNSSEIATGSINPEDASGRAILAVQQASQQPMVQQLINLKMCIEDIARIWLDMWTTYTPDGMKLEEEIVDTETGKKTYSIKEVPSTVLENLKANVKVDISPSSPYDKYAREMSLENLFKAGYFNPQKLGELKAYVEVLPDDSTMPKQELQNYIEKAEEEQRKIAEMNSQAQIMMQRANSFINSDVDGQAQQISDANQDIASY